MPHKMTDREWFSQIGICYDQTCEDMTQDEDPLAPAKGTWHGLLMVAPLWIAIGIVIFFMARHK